MHALTGHSMQRRQARGAAQAGDRHRCDWRDRAPAPALPKGGALACAHQLCNALQRPQQHGVQAAHAANLGPSAACACTSPRSSAAWSARCCRSMRRQPSTGAGLQPAGLVSRLLHATPALGPHLAHSTCATKTLRLGMTGGEAIPKCQNTRPAARLRGPRAAAAGCNTRHVEPQGMQGPSSQRPSRAASGLLRKPAHERKQ